MVSLRTLAHEYLRRQIPGGVADWMDRRLLGSAARQVSLYAHGHGSNLLDEAALRFLGRKPARPWRWRARRFETDEAARRTIAA